MHDQQAANTTVARLIGGANVARIVSVAAELKLADLLHDRPRTAAELAAMTETHAPSLYRLLRALASLGLFAERDGRVFEQTPLSETLRSDVAGSLRDLALFQNDEWYWQIYRDLPRTVRTGEPAPPRLWGCGLFDYFAANPEPSRRFNAGMASRHAENNAALAAGYDFSGLATLVDVGGGNGALLQAILARQPGLRGILFDLPRVVADAVVDERIRVVGGDFFESVPAGGDGYLLSNVLHDWQDVEAARILRNVRRAMPPQGQLLVVNEQVIPDDNEPNPGKLGDITMLLIGGRERTEREWAALFAEAGFELARIAGLQTRTGAGVLVGLPAGA